jgi:single-strand DNA-binding protein
VNKLTIIGNLTRDPESRTAGGEDTVCSFTVAVNRRTHKDHPEADFFRVSAWNKLGENCQRYLTKGKKVAVIGPVNVSSYEARDGSGMKFQMEIRAEDVEFLSPKEPSDADDSGC